jgi:Peptidase family M28
VLVYDGDFSDSPPPATAPTVNPGAAEIEQQFNTYFKTNGIEFEPTGFDGRSDYKAFQDNGKLAGGLFTGAEVEKKPEQVAKWGGLPNVAFDVNYHAEGDTIDNVDMAGFEKMTKAAAYVTGVYATRTLNAGGGAAATTKCKAAAPTDATHYRGDKLTR